MFTLLGVLPAWFPSDAAFIGLAVLIVAALWMNRGQWWVLNVTAQDEPVVVATGAFIMAFSGQLSQIAGLTQPMWLALGAFVGFGGIIVWNSDRMDIRNLI